MKLKARRTKRQQHQPQKVHAEAERLHEHAVIFEQLATTLIWRLTREIADEAMRGTVLLDYQAIALFLAAGDPATRDQLNRPRRGIWERYAHHFQNPATRRAFFGAVDSLTKQYLGDIVFFQADAATSVSQPQSTELLWDEALLPCQIAPHVLRQWIRDSAATRKFFLALFDHFADFYSKGSTGRRAILASYGACEVGWKPRELTKMLLATGDVNIGHQDNEADIEIALDRQAATVGRSLLRMRKKVERRRAMIAAEKRRRKRLIAPP